MERNKAECRGTGPASTRTLQRLARCPFPVAVMVTRLEGEELMVERNSHIAFADDPVCEC